MIKVVHVLATDRVSLTIPEIAERGGISRVRVKDAINDLKNAGVINEIRRKQFVIKKDLVRLGIRISGFFERHRRENGCFETRYC